MRNVSYSKAQPGYAEIEVFGLNAVYLGTARSFGEAKRMQCASLPEDLRPAYAGYQDGGPIFYAEALTPELLAKYPRLRGEADPIDDVLAARRLEDQP